MLEETKKERDKQADSGKKNKKITWLAEILWIELL